MNRQKKIAVLNDIASGKLRATDLQPERYLIWDCRNGDYTCKEKELYGLTEEQYQDYCRQHPIYQNIRLCYIEGKTLL